MIAATVMDGNVDQPEIYLLRRERRPRDFGTRQPLGLVGFGGYPGVVWCVVYGLLWPRKNHPRRVKSPISNLQPPIPTRAHDSRNTWAFLRRGWAWSGRG